MKMKKKIAVAAAVLAIMAFAAGCKNVEDDVNSLVSDAKDMVSNVVSKGGEIVSEGKDKVESVVSGGKEDVESAVSDVTSNMK